MSLSKNIELIYSEIFIEFYQCFQSQGPKHPCEEMYLSPTFEAPCSQLRLQSVSWMSVLIINSKLIEY